MGDKASSSSIDAFRVRHRDLHSLGLPISIRIRIQICVNKYGILKYPRRLLAKVLSTFTLFLIRAREEENPGERRDTLIERVSSWPLLRPLADPSATFNAWGASGISFSNIAAILIKKYKDGGRAQGKISVLHHEAVEKYLEILLSLLLSPFLFLLYICLFQ